MQYDKKVVKISTDCLFNLAYGMALSLLGSIRGFINKNCLPRGHVQDQHQGPGLDIWIDV